MTPRMARLGTIAALLTCLGCVGCDGSDADSADTGPPPPDAPGRDSDSGPVDPTPTGDGSIGFSDAGVGSFEGRVSGECLDGEDNDGNGAFDCDDPMCATAPVCCVGSRSEACCVGPGDTVTLALSECDDGGAELCSLDSEVELFGAVTPVIEDSVFVPQGMPAYAGAKLGEALDLRGTRLDFSATIRVPSSRCADCVDAAGIALVAPDDFNGGLNYVRLAILVIGARDETVLVVNGEVVDTFGLPDEELTGDLTIALRTGDDGSVQYTLAGADARTLPAHALPAAVVPTVLGQNENRAGEGAIAVVSAQRQRVGCDVPSALALRDTPVFPASISDYEPALALGRASVAVGADDQTQAVVEVDGSLHALSANGVGEFVPTMGLLDPGVVLLAGDDTRSFSAPWIERTEGGFQLYFVETSSAGNTQLVRQLFTTLTPGGAGTRTILLDAGTLMVQRIVSATHASETLIVALEDAAGTRLERFTPTSEEMWEAVGTVATPRPDDLFAFDRDEVGEPALVEQNDVLRLYYTGRRGTRRSIGLLVSLEGGTWRDLGEVLAPSSPGFASLQVSSPAPVTEGGALALYYLGRSGNDRRIGVARGVGTADE
ncbi:MAG: hypothetical protein AB8I08_15105 [Sandaracinaceae bacterium]